jgi:hypothetical protein
MDKKQPDLIEITLLAILLIAVLLFAGLSKLSTAH